MLVVDAVGALAALRFERFDGVPSLLHRAGHEPADGVLLPAHLVHDLRQRGAVLPLEHGGHLGRLAALPRPGGLLCPGGLFAVGRLLGGGGTRNCLKRKAILNKIDVGEGRAIGPRECQ